MPLRQFTAQDVHHRWCRTDQSHPPAVCSGVAQQGPGQLDASGFDHLHPLTGQGPDHAGTIGNHQVGRCNGFPQLGDGSGTHRHLSVEGDDATTPIGMKTDGSCLHVPAGIHGNTEHLATAPVSRGGGD